MKKITLALGSLAVMFTIVMVMDGTCYSADNLIYACIKKQNGQTRIVGKPSQCLPSEVSVYWNQVGPPGPKGDKGDKGPKGDKGDPGGGQGSVVITSFYFELPESGSSFTGSIPPDKGFVITDLVFTMLPTGQIYSTSFVDVYEGKPPGGVLKASFTIFWSPSSTTSGFSLNTIKEFHFNSGVPFSLGTRNIFFVSRGEGVYVLVSGYLINGP